ncbi:MAG: hypothetical protein AB7T49_17955 [Oligoflexales bacterium]
MRKIFFVMSWVLIVSCKDSGGIENSSVKNKPATTGTSTTTTTDPNAGTTPIGPSADTKPQEDPKPKEKPNSPLVGTWLLDNIDEGCATKKLVVSNTSIEYTWYWTGKAGCDVFKACTQVTTFSYKLGEISLIADDEVFLASITGEVKQTSDGMEGTDNCVKNWGNGSESSMEDRNPSYNVQSDVLWFAIHPGRTGMTEGRYTGEYQKNWGKIRLIITDLYTRWLKPVE